MQQKKNQHDPSLASHAQTWDSFIMFVVFFLSPHSQIMMKFKCYLFFFFPCDVTVNVSSTQDFKKKQTTEAKSCDLEIRPHTTDSQHQHSLHFVEHSPVGTSWQTKDQR